jgi:hypothetical protein
MRMIIYRKYFYKDLNCENEWNLLQSVKTIDINHTFTLEPLDLCRISSVHVPQVEIIHQIFLK